MNGWGFLYAIGARIYERRHPWGFQWIDTLTAVDGQAFPSSTPLRGGWRIPLDGVTCSDFGGSSAPPEPVEDQQ